MINGMVTGRLGADPEQRFTNDGTPILELRIASDNRKDGETTWVRASLFGERATKIAPYLAKGHRIGAAGTFELREYQKSSGEKGFALELRVSDIDLIQDRKDEPPQQQARRPAPGPSRPAAPPPGRGAPARPPPRAGRPAPAPARGDAYEGDDDNLPPPPF